MDVSAGARSRSGIHPSSRTRTQPRSRASGVSVAPCATVASVFASGAARNAMFPVGVRVLSVTGLAPTGAVDVAPTRTGAGAGDAPRAGAALGPWVGGADAATSPPLALRAVPLDLAGTVVRLSGVDEWAVSVDGLSSDDLSTHPSRETFAHPAGAFAEATATVVPASSDATLLAVAAPRTRTTAARLPTRGDELPRCAANLARSRKPSIVTLAYAPRVSRTRTDVPG